MAIIRQLKNYFTKQNIYPQTVEQAIYDSEGRRLDNKIANGLSNPNLLINSNFENLINQRGYVSGTDTNGAYTIDRWKTLGSLNLNNDYITLNSYKSGDGSTHFGYLIQRIEFPNKFRNKSVTLSVKYRTTDDYCHLGLFITKDTTSRIFFTHLPNTNGVWKTHSVSVQCEDIDYASFEYCIYTGYIYDIHDKWIDNVYVSAQEDTSIDIAWAKLEYGEIATPFRPRLYAEELQLCKRYFQVVNSQVSNTQWYDADNFRFYVPFEQRMRLTPTIIFPENSVSIYGESKSVSSLISGVTFKADEISSYKCRVVATKSAHGYSGALLCITKMYVDAEL